VPDRHVDHLLIGGGIASATAAATLREEGATGSVLLVGRELDPPYHRPPCSKGYLQGRESRADALIHPPQWWDENAVELLARTSVLALDPATRTATLSNKQAVQFETALVATGAMVRRLTVDGADLDGIHYLRTPGNTDAIRADVENRERIVMIGGSYIGSEVAASLTELGKRCTILMQEAVTLERAFGQTAGRHFQAILEAHGIEVIGEDEVDRFEPSSGADADLPRVATVVTKGGRRIEADAVVAGVGAQPDVMLARKAGLEIGPLGGVLADRGLRTSAPGVFVAGDIAEYDSVLHGRRMRIEHEDVAAAQGRTAALNMLGRGVVHDAVPYFFSDLSDWVSVEYVGPATTWDDEVVRGSFDSGRFTIWYLERGQLVAALTVGRSEDLVAARRLIGSGIDLADARQQLADDHAELAAIAP
jgi:3-phenylpropionate/trans-cinnamate dioxygenase ferredoxin reductase subunit